MDQEFIKKYHLEEASKRFQQICEYTFMTEPVLSEEGDDDQENMSMNTPERQGGQPSQMGSAPNQGQEQGQGEQMQAPPQGAQQGQPPLQNGMDDAGAGVGDQPTLQGGGQEMPDDIGFDVEDEGGMGEDDEVIDVDDLTQAQEASDAKIDGVNDKLTTLMNVVNMFTKAIENNDAKIEDLKAEFEKRNPTEEEKMNIRSQASYPYTELPRDYWEKKSAENPYYNVIMDNDVSTSDEDKQYEIRRGDIDVNDASIGKTLDMPSKLKDFIDF